MRMEIIPVRSLADLYQHVSGREEIAPSQARTEDGLSPLFVRTDSAEVNGQEHMERAVEVAAAGGQAGESRFHETYSTGQKGFPPL